MDVLSDVVNAARTGRPHSRRVARSAPFCEHFAAVPAAGFHVVLEGTCRLTPAQGEPVTLGPGDVAFLPRGSAHTLAGCDGSPAVEMLCGAYLLDGSAAHPLLDDLPDVVHLPARVGRHGQLRAALELLGAELDDDDRPGSQAVLLTLLDLLLLYILRAWFEDRHAGGHSPSGWAAALHDPAVAAALRAVHDDPAHPWTVEELGARASLSRAAFARRFTALAGRPPLAYLTWWRMATAARLLRGGDAPVHVIARQVGYSSQYTFTHAFKRQYGLPPAAYRRHAPALHPDAG
ncbi:AraC family transcriptional regulator [Nonomuraea salmonea]|uniref:AraC family transcriptional regulator n=1 Tax=Nonomuraea salmonea TaxID=46181 RepID=A0ABV5NGT2_9ACTN